MLLKSNQKSKQSDWLILRRWVLKDEQDLLLWRNLFFNNNNKIMALFGIQLIMTMVMLSFLHKFSVHYSLARWILSYRLIKYLNPSDCENKKSTHSDRSSHSKDHHRNYKKNRDCSHKDSNEYFVPKNFTITLEANRITPLDLIQLHYYTEYQWLIDFAFCALIIYFAGEFYYFLLPNSSELNLSLIWCFLVIAFTTKILFSLTALYFRSGDEAIGERSICIISGGLFFLAAMVVLITDENLLEFGLNSAYSSFNMSAYKLLENYNLIGSSSAPTSKLMFKFWLAVWSGLVGAFFIFPGLRFAQMHRDSLSYCKHKPKLQILLHLTFISPLIAILFWVKPVARLTLTERDFNGRGPLMSSDNFETLRILVIILIIALRFFLIPYYLQAYLNLAPRKLHRMSKESGKVKNTEVQKMVARVFYYLCVVALQYVSPALMALFTTFLMKTLGNYAWLNHLNHSNQSSLIVEHNHTITKFNLSELRIIFNPIVLRGILGFMNWWLVTVWFSTSTLGFVYHSYFST